MEAKNALTTSGLSIKRYPLRQRVKNSTRNNSTAYADSHSTPLTAALKKSCSGAMARASSGFIPIVSATLWSRSSNTSKKKCHISVPSVQINCVSRIRSNLTYCLAPHHEFRLFKERFKINAEAENQE